MPVSAILLDVGGVLVEPDHPFFAEAFRPFGVKYEPDAFTRGHFAGIAALDKSAAALGREGWVEYAKAYARSVGVTGERDVHDVAPHVRGIAGNHYIWCRPLQPNVDALGKLSRHVPVGIVSNAGGQVENMLRYTGICQVGEGKGTPVACVIDSHVVGIAKPDPAIFTPALAAIGMAGSTDIIYVGDTVFNDVNGSRAAGLRPIHLDPYNDCRDDSHEHIVALSELEKLV